MSGVQKLFTSILIVLAWAIATLLMLVPYMLLSWLLARWTDLTILQGCIIAFLHLGVVYYLLKVYFSLGGAELRWWGLVLAAFSLVLVTLAGYALRNWTDLTLFQAILAISGVHLLTAYLSVYSMLGSIPAFLRNSILEEMLYDLSPEDWE